MVITEVFGIVGLMHVVSNVMEHIEHTPMEPVMNKLKTADYVLLYILIVVIIYSSVSVMMEMYG